MRNYAELVGRLRAGTYTVEYLSIILPQAVDAIEELHRQVEQLQYQPLPGWISVEERLPDVATKVLTYNGDYVSENWMCTIIDKDGKRVIWAYSEKFVTHWMPLPEPPKEDDNGN